MFPTNQIIATVEFKDLIKSTFNSENPGNTAKLLWSYWDTTTSGINGYNTFPNGNTIEIVEIKKLLEDGLIPMDTITTFDFDWYIVKPVEPQIEPAKPKEHFRYIETEE